jgi:hypothetical protein
MMKEQGIVRYFADMDDINKMRENVVSYYALEALEKSGGVPTEEALQKYMDAARAKLEKNGDVFFDMVEEVAVSGIETRVQVTNEKMDTATVARNLLELMRVVPPEAQGETAAQVFDVLGLTAPKTLKTAPLQVAQGSFLKDVQVPDEMGEAVAANTQQNVGGY